MVKLGAKDLRNTKPKKRQLQKIQRNPIYIVLDNIVDTYNVGAMFRLADAVSAEKVILCGKTEAPPNSRIKKASINTTEWMEWQYASTAVEAISNIKSQISNIRIVAIEQSKKSVPYAQADYSFPLALVVGHETEGVSKEALNMADQIVEIPMWGVNKSLNVMVSLAIVLYKAMESE